MNRKFNRKLVVAFAISILLIIISCHKEGTGGKSTLSGYVKHHSQFIPNSVVYIKYGTSTFPGANTANYNASVTTGADAHFEFKDLRKGDYYLFGIGYDDSIMKDVSGGIPVKLKYNKSTTTNVPVSE